MITKRQLIRTIGAAVAVGIAGCLGRAQKVDDADGCELLPTEPNYHGWFDGVSNYRGTCDARGADHVTILNGATGNRAQWAFEPAAVAVSPGTTVRWEWTGKGGDHDVTSESGAFASGKPVSNGGTTFEHAFDAPGIYKYYCTPHKGMGMKGAIFVTVE